MTQKPTGGPAFPGPSFTQSGYPNGHAMGMTLRDWFAGQSAIAQDELGLDLAEALMGEKCPKYQSDIIAAAEWWAAAEAKLRFIKADAMIADRYERGERL
jgi:hypothetical protein